MAQRMVKQGSHYERGFPFHSRPFFGKTEWQGVMYFDASCEYGFTPEQNAAYDHLEDCNKLFGASLGLWNDNHQDCARWGFRWSKTNGAVELPAYTYANGIKQWDAQLRFPIVDTIPLETWLGWSLLRAKDGWQFRTYGVHVNSGDQRLHHGLEPRINYNAIRGNQFIEQPTLYTKPKSGWTQGMYFGGQEPAPHDVKSQLILF